MTNLVSLETRKKGPCDLADKLRALAARVEAGEVSGCIIAYKDDDNYGFEFSVSRADALVLSSLLHASCIERMR